MSTMSKPALTELADEIESVHSDLERILVKAQSLLQRHRAALEDQGDVDEELFVDFCEKDGYLAFAEALGRLQHVARELEARAFVGPRSPARDGVERPVIGS